MKLKEAMAYDDVKLLKNFNNALYAYQHALDVYLHNSNETNAKELKKQSHFIHLIHGDSFKEVEQLLKKEHNV